jgi:hypothetical protein
MTSPTPPTLTIATDQAAYAPGDLVTLTATYTDPNGQSFPVTVTAAAADDNSPPNTVTAQTTFTVNAAAIPAELMEVAVTDSADDTWTQISDAPGTAVFTTTAPSSP